MFTATVIALFIIFILYNVYTSPADTPQSTSSSISISDKTETEFKEYMDNLRNGIAVDEPEDMSEVVDYKTYITSLEWKNNSARRDVLYKDNYQCRMCKSSVGIEVHHITYKNLGNEHIGDLVTLCRDCHEYTHKVAGKGAGYYLPVRSPNV